MTFQRFGSGQFQKVSQSLIQSARYIRPSNYKDPAADSLPAEVFKYGGMNLTRQLVHLFSLIWCEERVSEDFKDASLIHLYRYKGDHTCCDNHCNWVFTRSDHQTDRSVRPRLRPTVCQTSRTDQSDQPVGLMIGTCKHPVIIICSLSYAMLYIVYKCNLNSSIVYFGLQIVILQNAVQDKFS